MYKKSNKYKTKQYQKKPTPACLSIYTLTKMVVSIYN